MNTFTETDTIKENNIAQMPANARVWVYQSNREFTETEIKTLLQQGQEFISSWTAHGASLKASFDFFYNRFIVIAVDEAQALASGCSIDKSVHFVREVETTFQVRLFDRLQVAYRSGNQIKTTHLNDLKAALLKDEEIENSEDIIVFNNMVTCKAEFDTQWQLPVKDSWHNRYIQ